MKNPTLDEVLMAHTAIGQKIQLPIATRAFDFGGVVLSIFDTLSGETYVVFEPTEPRGGLQLLKPEQVTLRISK